MKRHLVAVILALSVGIALIAGLVLLLTGTVEIGGDSATLAVELLAILALISGGLVAYISYEAARGTDDGEEEEIEPTRIGFVDDGPDQEPR